MKRVWVSNCRPKDIVSNDMFILRGPVFPEHNHAVDKIDAVLSGRFKINLQGQSVILEAGDCIKAPKGIKHSTEVIGLKPVISMDAIKE